MLALKRRGHGVVFLRSDSEALPHDIDVLHIHRGCGSREFAFARAAQERGAAVVWDEDDDMSSIPKQSTSYRRYGGRRWQSRLIAMRRLFGHVDLVTTTTDTLAARLRDAGAPTVVTVGNYVPAEWLRNRSPCGVAVTIGWIAGLEHQVDVERVPVRDALGRLLDQRSDVHIHTIGLKLGLRHERSTNTPVVPLLELTERAAAFDIGIAPLADIPLNRARSDVKLKEYAAAGLPWLASPVGPYAGLGERQGGRLVTDDRWYEELSRLVDKERDRRKLAKRGRKWVEGETLERNIHRWEDLLTATVEQVRAARH